MLTDIDLSGNITISEMPAHIAETVLMCIKLHLHDTPESQKPIICQLVHQLTHITSLPMTQT